MHIVNIMLSRIGGGIEQSFVDYTEGLRLRGHTMTAITHPKAVINFQLAAMGVTPMYLPNIGEWDVLAMRRLRKILYRCKPDAILAHTGRSFALSKYATREMFPLIGIAHNYNKRASRFKAAQGVLTTTCDLVQFLTQQQIPPERIFHIPNMIKCTALPVRGKRNDPPVIGSMGRFVKKKGFDVYIEALKILRDRGYRFKAILGGVGEEERNLKMRITSLGLGDIVTLPGWIKDKKDFYTHIDIFCLPSLHEPFGIVLLEAFTHGTPVIATDSEGPRDIITPNFDAVIVKKNHPAELASAMARMLDEPDFAATLAANAFVKAKTHYSLESVSERIEKAVEKIIAMPR